MCKSKIQCIILVLHSPVVGIVTETVGCIVLPSKTSPVIISSVGTGGIDALADINLVDLMEKIETDISLMVFIKVEGDGDDNIPADNVSLLLGNCSTLESHDVTDNDEESVGAGLL